MRLVVLLLTVLTTGCAAATVTSAGRVPSGDPLKIAVSPAFTFAGGAVMLTWRIERDENLRAFCVDVVGFRRFCEEHPSRRIYQQLLEGVPAGHWPVELTAYYANGVSRVAFTEFCVSGMEVSCGGPD
jgi:hypothetical protein